jgi:hypothetical protein
VCRGKTGTLQTNIICYNQLTTSNLIEMKRLKKVISPLFITSLVVGTLDGLAAIIMYSVQTGKDPMNVFRFIASGIFGTSALSGGVSMALWGIAFHYIISLGWTILFFWLADRFSPLSRNWIISGVMYGIFVWVIMNLVVMPLSLVPMKVGPKEWSGILKGALILIVCIGLPISYSARKYLIINS